MIYSASGSKIVKC